METRIKVDNLKCGGCANTIIKTLLLIPEVFKVNVYTETDEVVVEHENMRGLELAKEELKRLGYPESGTVSGFGKVTTNLKSYVSCAVGKLSDQK